MSECTNCKKCVYRKMNEDRTKTLATKDGCLICDLGMKNKVLPTDTCMFARTDEEGKHTPEELIHEIKDNVIPFAEDGFIGRKLTLPEKLVIKKNVKKYYPDFKN